MEYRKCFVPFCNNDTNNSPNKIFVRIRKDLQEKWCQQVNTEYFKTYTMYCCEDHLDPREDIANYYQCKLIKQEPRLQRSAKLRNIAQHTCADLSELNKTTSTSNPLKRKHEDITMPTTSSCSILPMKALDPTQQSGTSSDVGTSNQSEHTWNAGEGGSSENTFYERVGLGITSDDDNGQDVEIENYIIKEEVKDEPMEEDPIAFEDTEVKVEEHPVVDTNDLSGAVEFVPATSDNLPKVNMFAIVELFAMKPSYRSLDYAKIKQETGENSGNNSVGFVQVHKHDTKYTIQGTVAFNTTESHTCVVKYEEKYQIIEYTSCDCKNSACEHVIAFVMWLHRRTEERIQTTLDHNLPPEIQKNMLSSEKQPFNKDTDSGTQEQLSNSDTDSDIQEQVSNSNTNSETQPASKKHNVLNEFLAVSKNKIVISPLVTSCTEDNTNTKPSLLILMCKAEELNIKDADEFIEFCRRNVSEQDCLEAARGTAFNNEVQHELEYGRIVEDLVYDVSEATSENAGQLVDKILKPSVKEKDMFLNHVITVVEKRLKFEITRCGVLISDKYPIFCGSPYGVTDEHVLDVAYVKDDETIENYIESNRLKERIRARLLLLMFLAKKQKAYFILRNKNFKTCKKLQIHEFSFNNQNCMELINKCMKFWKEYVYKRRLCR